MRLAILGPNGASKSTLLKTIVGLLPAQTYRIDWGHHVDVGYYDQEQSDLDDTKTVIDQVWDERSDLDETSIRKALAQFMFRGEDVVKPVAGLSGGERSRLNLCRLMLRRANVLVMDEPTNHLDIPSKEALEQALSDYSGTLLFVSHDRYFIDAIATHVGILEPDGLVKYIGNYSDYREKVAENERMANIELSTASVNERTGAPTNSDLAAHQASPRRRIRSSDVRKLQEEIEKWERTAAKLESRLTAIGMEQSEAAAAQDIDRIRTLEQEREHVEQACQSALEKWEQASLKLEMLQSGED
ncbi:ATP-binding cassette domain-containing protein [Alicyclobacillus sacchari]|uniref:ATP-binding cassette domain-containing protein n=1 Tax=Alicyclobacillus sacchari TaxID=392010 RepID=UPI0024E0E184|nr:ATP-binding cassette domain-containing protein [Alicyclobacillus sacchari]